jgi:hypothetical protein
MPQKVLISTIVAIICVLFIVSAGCVSTKEGAPAPGTQTPAVTGTQSQVATPVPTQAVMPQVTAAGTPIPRDEALDRDGTLARDAAFNALLAKSAEEIANKTDLVIFEMSQSETLLKGGYSSARLFLAADDLGYTTESYYDQMLKTKASTMENENKRIEYIQFLYLARNAANHIADAAEAESFGNYQAALVMAAAAKDDLAGMEKGSDLPVKSRYNRLNVYLAGFIGRMQDNVIQQKTLETILTSRISDRSPGDRFPRRS